MLDPFQKNYIIYQEKKIKEKFKQWKIKQYKHLQRKVKKKRTFDKCLRKSKICLVWLLTKFQSSDIGKAFRVDVVFKTKRDLQYLQSKIITLSKNVSYHAILRCSLQ